MSTNISSLPPQFKFTAKGLAAGMKISITTTGDGQAVVRADGWYNQVVESKLVFRQPDSGAKGTVSSWPAAWRWLTNNGTPPTLTTTAGGADVVLLLAINGTRQYAIHLTPGPGAQSPDVQKFTDSGPAVNYIAPAGGRRVRVVCIPSTPGAGSGAAQGTATQVVSGGSTPGGVGYTTTEFEAFPTGTSVPVVVPPGGVGGAPVTATGSAAVAGNPGTAGGDVLFGNQCRAKTSLPGQGGQVGAAAATTNPGGGLVTGGAGAASRADGGDGQTAGSANMCPGGGSGGGLKGNGTFSKGGDGQISLSVPQGTAGLGGTTAGAAGTSGTSARDGLPGNSSGGGASNPSGPGGAGGDGTVGGGPGGGGASGPGQPSGKGGDGKGGICIAVTTF